MSRSAYQAFRGGRRGQLLGVAGPSAALVFLSSLVGFAAVRTDGYTHGTKAISELGAVGAPWAAGFNLLGFGGPGLLIVVLAFALHQHLDAGRRLSAGSLLLALSGLTMAGAGVFPVNMGDPASPTSIAHLIMAQATGILWAASLFWLAPRMRRTGGFEALGRVTPWFALFLLANIVWQIAWQTTGAVLPGWGQRTAFAGYYAWAGLAGWRSLVAPSPSAAPSSTTKNG